MWAHVEYYLGLRPWFNITWSTLFSLNAFQYLYIKMTLFCWLVMFEQTSCLFFKNRVNYFYRPLHSRDLIKKLCSLARFEIATPFVAEAIVGTGVLLPTQPKGAGQPSKVHLYLSNYCQWLIAWLWLHKWFTCNIQCISASFLRICLCHCCLLETAYCYEIIND